MHGHVNLHHCPITGTFIDGFTGIGVRLAQAVNEGLTRQGLCQSTNGLLLLAVFVYMNRARGGIIRLNSDRVATLVCRYTYCARLTTISPCLKYYPVRGRFIA